MDVYDNLMQSLGEEYSLVRQLRSDGQNSVSVWRHNSSGRWYVLRRFEGGCEAYKKLLGVASPHLPQIYEAASSGGLSAVLEEYVCGDTLAFLLEEGPLPADAARAVARQLCAALWILHSRGVVHRDIKPENVIVRGSEAVLIDLGAARIYKCGGSGDTQVLGTTGYAAPEQYGLAQSDARADIYSLGVLLNVMLTGRHPSCETAGGHLGRVIQKCTMTSPAKRYADVLHLMRAL